jgi:serine/threonine protein kinase
MRWWEELKDPLLGRYRVKRLLGQGGMAEVLLAEDERFEGKLVAIKAPNLQKFAPDELAELLTRFQLEVRRQAREPITGVVPMIDAGEIVDANGIKHSFLVMDFLSGGSLGDLLAPAAGSSEARRQTLAEVLAWLQPIARTLDRLHARKLLHRDVKPDNILFNSDGDPFLADFGISTTLDEASGNSATSALGIKGAGPGSMGYRSPESIRGEKSTSSDQFSLAVTAYRALAGQPPMAATSGEQWFLALAHWNPTPLSIHCPDMPSESAAAVMKGLSLEPRHRFASCSEFAAAVGEGARAPRARLPSAPPDPVPAPPKVDALRPESEVARAPAVQSRKTGRRWVLAASLVLAIGLGFVGLKLLRENQVPPQLDQVPDEATSSSVIEAQAIVPSASTVVIPDTNLSDAGAGNPAPAQTTVVETPVAVDPPAEAKPDDAKDAKIQTRGARLRQHDSATGIAPKATLTQPAASTQVPAASRVSASQIAATPAEDENPFPTARKLACCDSAGTPVCAADAVLRQIGDACHCGTKGRLDRGVVCERP